MKMQITGAELNAGVSMKSGTAKPYSIGQLHAMLPLAPGRGEGNFAKGFVGSTYECDAELLRKIEKLPFPITAEVELQDVMQFGKRKQIVTDIKPGTLTRAS